MYKKSFKENVIAAFEAQNTDPISWINNITALASNNSDKKYGFLRDSIFDWAREYEEAFIRFMKNNKSYVYQLVDSSSDKEESIGYFNSYDNAIEKMRRTREINNNQGTFTIHKHPVDKTPDDYGFKDFLGLRFNGEGQLTEMIINQYFWLDDILTNVLYND